MGVGGGGGGFKFFLKIVALAIEVMRFCLVFSVPYTGFEFGRRY